jgi:hypothetical protein
MGSRWSKFSPQEGEGDRRGYAIPPKSFDSAIFSLVCAYPFAICNRVRLTRIGGYTPMADTQPVSPVAHGTAVFAGVLMIIAGLSRP